MPDTALCLIAKDRAPVRSESGLTIVPTHTLEESPSLDILFVPGGRGVCQWPGTSP
jgi:cyclohexyl-isocyanide hydratase